MCWGEWCRLVDWLVGCVCVCVCVCVYVCVCVVVVVCVSMCVCVCCGCELDSLALFSSPVALIVFVTIVCSAFLVDFVPHCCCLF